MSKHETSFREEGGFDAGKDEAADKIALRDYIREVEIGAFQEERGKTQRIRFDIVVDVAETDGASDDVDRILSYDSILNAVETQLHAERLNLLEALAERIAAQILLDRRAKRVFVRIDKLDRVPGALSIEMTRTRRDRLVSLSDGALDTLRPPQPVIVHFSPSFLNASIGEWVEQLVAAPFPAIVTFGDHTPYEKGESLWTQRRIALLKIEQMAWRFAARAKALVVMDTRTELEHAMRTGILAAWAPSKMAFDNVKQIALWDGIGLTNWLADELAARNIIWVGGVEAEDICSQSTSYSVEDISAFKRCLSEISQEVLNA